MSYVSPPREKKIQKQALLITLLLAGERLSFPRKIAAFYTLVTKQEGLEKEKTFVTNFVC